VLDSLLLAEAIIEAELPAGVVNIVPAGREVGAYLVEHPGIDKVAFTGSTAAGRTIARRCGELLRPVTLELGGKSAAIVLDDADLAGATEALFAATMNNNGQTCNIGTRILAPRSRYDEVLEVFSGLANGLVVGDSLDPATQVGPLASARQRDRVEGYIAAGLAGGARLSTGGGRPVHLERGWFVEPTVFSGVDNASPIAREEIFGPVLSVIPAPDEAAAITIANDTIYGLNAAVFTQDVDRARWAAGRLRSGTVGQNGSRADFGIAFGGYKQSGVGREGGTEGLLPYLETKTIILDGPPSQR
jgi:acyl-CoA reductase-like NAD-dependent aldehyde dehydrogenase